MFKIEYDNGSITTSHHKQYIVVPKAITDVHNIVDDTLWWLQYVDSAHVNELDIKEPIIVNCNDFEDILRVADMLNKCEDVCVITGEYAVNVANELDCVSDIVVQYGDKLIVRDINPNLTATLIRRSDDHQFDFPVNKKYIILAGKLATEVRDGTYVAGRRTGETLLHFANGKSTHETLKRYSSDMIISIDAGDSYEFVLDLMSQAKCKVIFTCTAFIPEVAHDVVVYENIEELCAEKVRCLEYRKPNIGNFVY